jgi:hypothetical protein
MTDEVRSEKQPEPAATEPAPAASDPAKKPKEIGGPKGPEPTRYGDWERGGICVDF